MGLAVFFTPSPSVPRLVTRWCESRPQDSPSSRVPSPTSCDSLFPEFPIEFAIGGEDHGGLAARTGVGHARLDERGH